MYLQKLGMGLRSVGNNTAFLSYKTRSVDFDLQFLPNDVILTHWPIFEHLLR